jgi:alkanesulfonate monooxygenase SsuD/methylene tetrahydromethanopterin reductase-like flavin-dependent oxidoreductase (luciferase family)
VHAYYNAFVKRKQKHTDYQSNCNIAMVSYFMCSENDEEARRLAEGVTFFQFALAYYSGSRNRERAAPGTVSLWDEYQAWKRANPERAERALMGGLIGSPDTIRRKLHRFVQSKVDSIILLNQAGRNRHEHICEGLELFAREVMPEFHAMEPEHLAWKQRVLNREIELEEIDTAPYRERGGVGKGVTIDRLVAAQ